MTLRENDEELLLNGTTVRAINTDAHHLLAVGNTGIIRDWLPYRRQYKVQYSTRQRDVILAYQYPHEFEVITDDD